MFKSDPVEWIKKNYKALLFDLPFWIIGFILLVLILYFATWIKREYFSFLEFKSDILTWIVGLAIAFRLLVWRENKAMERENRQYENQQQRDWKQQDQQRGRDLILSHRQLQEWFQEIFITNGIEEVLAYVSQIKLNNPLTQKSEDIERLYVEAGRIPRDTITLTFPIWGLNRIRKLLGSDDVFYLIDNIRMACFTPRSFSDKKQRHSYVGDVLRKIDATERLLTNFWDTLLAIEIDNKMSINELKDSEALAEIIRECRNTRHMPPERI